MVLTGRIRRKDGTQLTILTCLQCSADLVKSLDVKGEDVHCHL